MSPEASVDFLSALKHSPTGFLLVLVIGVATFMLGLTGLLMMRQKPSTARPIVLIRSSSALIDAACKSFDFLSDTTNTPYVSYTPLPH